VQLWGLYRPLGPPSLPWFPHVDKVEHVMGFGIPLFVVLLTVARWSAPSGRRIRSARLLLVVGLFAIHGIVSELVQGTFYVSRSADPMDVLADWTGIILAVLGYRLLTRRHSGQAGP
jgi:hypothetical protein